MTINIFKEYRSAWHVLLLVLLALLVFSNTLFFGFVWDDNIFLVGQAVYESATLQSPWLSPLNSVEYLPLRDLSYIIDYRVWGWNPFGFHLTNLLLYCLNVLAVYWLTRIMDTFLFNTGGTGKDGVGARIALASAALFAVLPLHSEVVSFIHARNVLLSGLFFFLSCIYYLKFIDSQRWLHLLAAFALFACALLSKATTIMLPLILVMFLYFRPTRTTRAYLGVLPFAVLAVVFFFIFKYHATESQFINEQLILTVGDYDYVSRLAVALQIPFFYLSRLLIPLGLSTEYQIEFSRDLFSAAAIFAMLGLGLLLSLAYLYRRRLPRALFALLWFLICLIPVSNIFLTNPVVADRYVYLSSYAYAYGFAVMLMGIGRKTGQARLLIILLPILGIYAWLAFERNDVWRTHESVMQDMTKPYSNRAKGHNALGQHYFEAGQYTQALENFAKAKEISPLDSRLEYHQAKLAYLQNRPDEALKLLDAASRIYEDQPYDAWILRGQIYESRADLVQAARFYRRAVASVHPTRASEEQARAILQRVMTRLEPSLAAARRGIVEHPDDLNRIARLAQTLQTAGLNAEAIKLYEDLIKLGGPRWEVYANLGKLYKQEGLFEQSIDNYRKSIELNGASAKIHNELGIVYIDAGRFEEALAQFQATVEIDPKSAQALLNLAKLHYHLGNKQAAYDAFNRILREFPAYESLARDYLNKL